MRTPAWEGAKALAPAKSAKRVIVLVYCDLQKENKVRECTTWLKGRKEIICSRFFLIDQSA